MVHYARAALGDSIPTQILKAWVALGLIEALLEGCILCK